MRFLLKLGLFLLVVVGICAGAYRPVKKYWADKSKPTFRTTKVTRGDIVFEIDATGKIKPTLEVQIGAVSGGAKSAIRVWIDTAFNGGLVLPLSEIERLELKVRLVEHLEDCRRMDIDVAPPDVNSSHADFAVACHHRQVHRRRRLSRAGPGSDVPDRHQR